VLRDRAWIAHHVPHKGTMCLLDGVLAWDAASVRCMSRAHRDPRNPLRARGQLSAVCGIEFAAQAMAVHGALIGPELRAERQFGYLAALREINLHVSRLDDIEDDLIADAERVAGDHTTVLYTFVVSAGNRPLLAGRATIVTNPAGIAAYPAAARQ
jgi:predicted hotdog family 3-hydroxylacyl-ACP dehydratase